MPARSLIQKRCLALAWAVVGAALISWTFPAYAATADMAHSLHDFSWQTGYATLNALAGDEICRPCHVPHNADEPQYLFRDFGTTWDTPLGHELILPESTLCLGCHDGTIAPPGGGTDTISGLDPELKDPHFWNDAQYPNALETDPKYVPTLTPGLHDAFQNSSGKWVAQNPMTGLRLPLYTSGDPTTPRMACTTCHDPHVQVVGTTGRDFLRSAEPYGELCITCHSNLLALKYP